MKSIDELTKRWLEIQAEKAEKPKQYKKPRSPVEPLEPKKGGDMKSLGALVAEVVDSLTTNNKPNAEQSDSDKKATEEYQKAIYKENINDLKDPILWFKRVAVGESKRMPGWWNVVPPIGFVASYIGPTARERAIAQAQIIQDWYE